MPGYHACLLPISEDRGDELRPLEWIAEAEGELAIGGPCVGLGYVGRPDLTAEKFIPHPLSAGNGERLYRTGDRVRMQADRKIVFLGRIDTQVKHRGFRIELGEIEARMYSVPEVQAAAVILANAGTEEARLEAFVVLRPDACGDLDAMHTTAFDTLPSYMRPEEVIMLEADEMPRLPSGKINAKALQDVSRRKAAERDASQSMGRDIDAETSSTTTVVAEGPLDMLLGTLAVLFPQAGRIRSDADIFNDLGGHSMLAAILVSRLRKMQSDTDGTIPFASIGLVDIYDGRTPAKIAARFTSIKSIDSDSKNGTATELTECDRHLVDGHLPITQTRFMLCGLAQTIPILFLCLIQGIEIMVPYLIFDFLALRGRVGWAIFAAYAVFVVLPPFLTILAVVSKWVLLGKVKPGEHPLYGQYYFRWWLAERLASLVNEKLIADSPLYPTYLRLLGAEIGRGCHIGAMSFGACGDLLEVGDDVIIGADVLSSVCVIERGRLALKRVIIGHDAIIGSNSVIEGGAVIGEASEVAALTLVPDCMSIPALQRYHGSPARFERHVKPDLANLGRRSRPSRARAAAITVGHALLAGLLLPLLYLVPQIPGLMLFDVLDLRSTGAWGQVAVLSLPIALAYQCLIFAQFLLLRRVFLGRLHEGSYSLHGNWYLRKWTVDRLMDLALGVLHPVFATLYIVPFLRLLGVKIGSRAEVSTARGLSFELLSIGEESFVADSVMLGDVEVRGNILKLKKTVMEPRAFAGNCSVVPQGTILASGTLLGVLSIAPPADTPMAQSSSCFGSPPVLMPTRQKIEGHAESLLYRPSKARVAARLTVEGCRIVLPRALIVFGLGFALQLAYAGYDKIGAVYTLLFLPIFYLIWFAIPALLITALLKWTLIGRYKNVEWPLWSMNVWLSEAVTSTYETIAKPLLLSLLEGSPYLAWCLRLMGVRVGSRACLLSSDITEFDCVNIGDEAMINRSSGPQTHLFQDRIMAIGHVSLGNKSCLKPYSICLPGSAVSDNAQLGSLSLLMKNENLPEHTAWEGAPVAPRQDYSCGQA